MGGFAAKYASVVAAVALTFSCGMQAAVAKDHLYLITVRGAVQGSDSDVDSVGGLGARWGNTTRDALDSRIGKAAILRRIDRLQPQPGRDVVFFYYSGHGGTDSRGHFLALDSGERLHRSELRQRLVQQGAKLTILVTDCCANYVPGSKCELGVGMDYTPENLARLFQFSGVADINSATAGQVAWGEMGGGLFTQEFVLAFVVERHRDWQSLLSYVSNRTEGRFGQFKRQVLSNPQQLDPREIQILRNQPTQRPEVFSIPVAGQMGGGGGTIPPPPPPPPPPAAGVAVIQVFPGTTATNLSLNGQVVRLDVGDVILSINGQQIRTPQDFGRIVDSLPAGAMFQMRVLDGKTGQQYLLSGRLDQGGGYRFGATVDDR